jgi:hypothetical protein
VARLRVRIELNRGGVGVPLHKLASVVQESQRFFQMLAQDVHIERERGEWLAFDFDPESLNFTAEYVGPVSADQVRAFCAAFDGVTSLRRATIAQFTRIADAIGEDELIGFGLYPSSHEIEPSEWRCLSRRDALRIADEIQLLLGAAGELEQETYFPSVFDRSAGARLFKERHDRSAPAVDQSRWPNFVREVESTLSKRIGRLEGEVENHSHLISNLRENSATVEESVRSLLSSVESFCGQATRQIQRYSAPQLPAPPRPPGSGRNWRAILVAAIVVIGIVPVSLLLLPSKPHEHAEQVVKAASAVPAVELSKPVVAAGSGTHLVATSKPKGTPAIPVRPVEPAKSEVTAADVAATTGTPEPNSEPMHVDLEAREPAWVSITDVDGKHLYAGVLQANETRSIDLTKGATLRTGNAGGLIVRFNGKEIGDIGPVGKIRDVEFQNGAFRIL